MTPEKVFKDETAPAYALLASVLQVYGMDALEVEPELIKEQIDKDYSLKFTQLQSDKLQAAITVMTTNQFEEDWRVFEVVCNVLCNQAVDTESVNPAEADEIATALAEVALIRNSISDDTEGLHYSDEVRAYAGRMFYDYGLSKPPQLFPSAIMPPEVVDCKDDEKNEALNELFSSRATKILEYLE